MNKPVDVLIGQQFGNYRLVRILGRGGFASVYLGENIYINTLVAVKVLHTEMDQSEMEHFRFEARTIASLKHPHIVQLIDFGIEQKTPYLVMSYAPHGHLRQLQTTVGTLPLPTVVAYIKQIASALQFAHDHKIVHRDIKPENILLDAHNSLLLSDFGIALIVQTTRQASSRNITGTLSYMAPEQTQGKSVPASDQYALGVTTYELLTGTLPFKGSLPEVIAQHISTPPPSLRTSLPTLPLSVDQVILRSLAKNPQERFPSVGAFAEALEMASGRQESQEIQQGSAVSFYEPNPSTQTIQRSFEGKTVEQATFVKQEETATYIQSINAAHNLVKGGFDETPTAPLPSLSASTIPSVSFPESTSQRNEMHKNTPLPVLFSIASPFPEQENIPSEMQNGPTGKRRNTLLSIALISVVMIIIGSSLFMLHTTSKHTTAQTGVSKQPSATPTNSGQQSPTAEAKSTPIVGIHATRIVRSTPTTTGNIARSTVTAVASEPTTQPLPTATSIPTPTSVPVPTPTVAPIPTPIPTQVPSTGACNSFTGFYKIVNRNSGKNLDVLGGALTDSAKIVQYADNGKADQQWSFVTTSTGYCKIKNRKSGRLLNIPGPTATTATQLIQFYDDGNANSQWELVPVGNGTYKIVSRYDSQCVDVSQLSTSDNAAVIQFTDNGGLNQQWQLVVV